MDADSLDYFFYLNSINDYSIDNPNKISKHYQKFGNQKYDFKMAMFKKIKSI